MTIALSLALEIALAMSPIPAHRELARTRADLLRTSEGYLEFAKSAAEFKPVVARDGTVIAGSPQLYAHYEQSRQKVLRVLAGAVQSVPVKYIPALTRRILRDGQ